MARRQSDSRPRIAADQPDGICFVKLERNETAGTLAVAFRSLASQLERYERDRPWKGMRFDRATSRLIIELRPSNGGGEQA